MTDPERSRELERRLTIQKIVDDSLPISELQRTVGNREVAQALDIQLTRLVGSLNLKWNLSDSQIKTIVEDLLDKYKNESIEDFILVFKKARQGEFGELYRLDSPVIFGWMDKYLDEKYQVVEKKLMDEKESYYKTLKHKDTETDWLKLWRDKIEAIEVKNVVPLTTKEIIEEGQSKPKHEKYVPPDESYVVAHELHLQWARENHDPYTGKPKANWISEEDWIKEKQKS